MVRSSSQLCAPMLCFAVRQTLHSRYRYIVQQIAYTCYTCKAHNWNRNNSAVALLPHTQNCGLRMRRECRGRLPRHRLRRKPLVSDPGMHHGTCVTHAPWCMSGSLTLGGVENVPGIPGACTTHSFAYLVNDPLNRHIPDKLGHYYGSLQTWYRLCR